MKQRILLIFLALLLLLSACGAENSTETKASSYLYYPATDVSQGSLLAVPSAIAPNELSPKEFLKQYLQAAPPEEGEAVLPFSWSLAEFSMEGTSAQIRFTGGKVSLLRRSLAFSCLTKTLLQHPLIRSVSILSPESENPTVLTENDILLEDTGMEPPREQVTLYFPDAQRRYLISETRSVDAAQGADKPTFILNALLSEGSDSCIPQGTTLLSVSVENGVCTVDLSSEFEQGMEESFAAQRMALYSIVNSLTELPEITTVDLWVAGAPLHRLHDLDLSQGLSRDQSVFFAPGSDDYSDAALYLSCGNEGLLAEIPLLLDGSVKNELVSSLIQSLISFESRNGLRSCLPQGTKLLSVRMENSTCVLDFTGEFLAGCHNDAEELLAVRSVIASVSSIEGISAVEILVEGIEPNFRNESLKTLRRSQKDWILP